MINSRFLDIWKRSVGQQYARQVAEMEKDAFPLLLIVVRSRGFLDLINVIEGKSTPSEVLLNLMQSHDEFDQQRQRDMKEETIRETRENLKKQQEDEYNQSLEADLAKEESRQADERRQRDDQRASEQLKQKRLVDECSLALERRARRCIFHSARTTRLSGSSTRGAERDGDGHYSIQNSSA